MIENGDHVIGSVSRGPTYLGVATDHVIESFRNRLWADYKTWVGSSITLRESRARRTGRADHWLPRKKA